MISLLGNAPVISPVAAGVARPLWSVMIPTYNCAKYLRQTLQSVLAQDLGPDQMQIEVVDDCSTADRPEEVVAEVGGGRVSFFRKEHNAGSTANFNTCLERSRGHLIHILHGDDWVLPGFYQKLAQAADRHAECAFFGTRCFFADESSYYTFVTRRLLALEERPSQSVQDFFLETPVQFAGVVIRRRFYETHGGFLSDLHHTADWEMWTRAIAQGSGMILPDVLAVYRVFAANETGRMARSAENLHHRAQMNNLLDSRHVDFPRAAAERLLLHLALAQERRFAAEGDDEAAAANRNFWMQRAPRTFRLRQVLHSLANWLRS